MTARFSPCFRYRYELWRDTGGLFPGRGVANFIMLNPSTADETANDPTVERCEARCRSWGYDRLVVTNLFAWRSTDPRALLQVADPVGPENDETLVRIAAEADLVLIGWGNHGRIRGRGGAVAEMLRRRRVGLHALRVTKEGQPEHPLYLPYTLGPTTFGE